jgi:hypothetical protein
MRMSWLLKDDCCSSFFDFYSVSSRSKPASFELLPADGGCPERAGFSGADDE